MPHWPSHSAGESPWTPFSKASPATRKYTSPQSHDSKKCLASSFILYHCTYTCSALGTRPLEYISVMCLGCLSCRWGRASHFLGLVSLVHWHGWFKFSYLATPQGTTKHSCHYSIRNSAGIVTALPITAHTDSIRKALKAGRRVKGSFFNFWPLYCCLALCGSRECASAGTKPRLQTSSHEETAGEFACKRTGPMQGDP